MEKMDKEFQKIIRNFALSPYIGYKCVHCGREYKSLKILEESKPICVKTNPIKLACELCWKEIK